ncbi:hypothetical protein LMG27952_06032 [Paraburkholderia hiiakae]|uniref:Uncharacterized protein n=1 Tax=Paraburkholderia hiiakae TaxID=1081782 RepID=A0ABM8P4K4_9BURK|nr:hypothetical protein [Paraburkholderia hiiakae]CAD6556292.1 hypothetical protein LMG27952_06032 [Paraburkholderia hiiakae]
MASSRRLVSATSISQASGAPAPAGADGFAATITTLRPASGHERAELIRDVIDAFRRLRNSIERFDRMLARGDGGAGGSGVGGTHAAQVGASLQPLLVALSRRVDLARFARQRELKRAIRDARRLDKTRDALFSDAFCLDTEALRRTAAELERLDAAFVGLGVEHVLAQHANAAEARSAAHSCEVPADRSAAKAKANAIAVTAVAAVATTLVREPAA